MKISQTKISEIKRSEMKTSKMITILLFIFLIVPYTLFSDTGGDYGAILKLEGTAGFIAVAKTPGILKPNVSSIYYNPADLYNINAVELSLTYSQPYSVVDGIHYGGFDLTFPLYDYGIGLSYSYFGLNNMREAVYDKTTSSHVLTNNTFNARYSIARVSLSGKIIENFTYGGTLKYFNESITNSNVTNIMADVGLLYKLDKSKISLFLKNIAGISSNTKTSKYKLPFCVELGKSYQLIDVLVLSSVFEINDKSDFDFRFAVIYNIENNFYLSGGYINSSQEFSGGLIADFEFYKFEYAVSSHSELNLSHRISFNIHF